jgi:hypothetical protein
VTAIAEGAVNFVYTLLTLIADSAIRCHSNLCVMKCSSLLDLLLDESKCVHLFSPEVGGFSPLTPKGDPSFPFLQSFASQ